MATLEAQTPDGSTLNIDVPEGMPETNYPHLVDDAVAHYMSTKQGGLESFGRAAVNNLPAGGQLGALGTAAMGNEPYSQAMQEWNQKIAQAKEQHPNLYKIGAVTGSVAPLAIPGVGEAMATAPAITGAGLGALNAVGNIDIAQNPGEAAKEAAIGAGTGAALGAILPSGKKLAESAEGLANRKAVEASGLPAGLLNQPKEDIEKLGQTMHELGLTQGTMDEKINNAQMHLKDIGASIGALGQNIPPVQDASPYIQRLQDLAKESSEIFEPGANNELGTYRQAMANLSKPGLTFDKLQQYKSSVGDRAFDALSNVKNDALANVYGVYKDAMKDIVSASPVEYQDLMDKYGDLLDINKALGKVRGNLNAGALPGKPMGLIGKLGAMVTGGNVPATMAAAAAITPFHPYMGAMLGASLAGNPNVVEGVARGVSAAAPAVGAGLKLGSIDAVTTKLVNMLSKAPQQLGKFAQPLINAAKTGGSQGLAAQHFLLSQQYPEYNEMMMEMGKHLVHKGSEEAIDALRKGNDNANR